MTGEGRIPRIHLALGMVLYALQGVVVAYIVNYNKSYMIAGGVHAVDAGRVETAVLLTLVFKFLLGPLSDRFSPFGLGHRRPFIVLGLVLQSAGLVGLTLFHPGTHLAGYAAMAFLAVAGLCLYDTCCDGMVVDLTAPDERVRVQGLLQASRFLTTMAFTLGFGLWMTGDRIGPGKSDGVLWLSAFLGLLPMIPAIAARDRGDPAEGPRFDWSALRSLARPGAIAVLAFGALYGMISYGVEFNLSLYYKALGYDESGVGIFGATRYGGRAAGALLLPLCRRALGRRGLLAVGLVALAATTAGQSAVSGGRAAGFWAFVFGMANGWNDALFFVLAMEATDPRMAASIFAIFMAISNLGVVGDALFLEAAAALGSGVGGFRSAFLTTSALSLGLLALIPSLTRPRSTGAGG
jgi:PAT family beta-lactamase induction signal transducer AmpG